MGKFLELYERYALEGIGLVMILVLFLLCVEIHKVNKMKKQMEKVIDKVISYVDTVLQEDEPAKIREMKSDEGYGKETSEKDRKEEDQSRIINAVLEEIFP